MKDVKTNTIQKMKSLLETASDTTRLKIMLALLDDDLCHCHACNCSNCQELNCMIEKCVNDIANEIGGSSKAAKVRALKAKRMGQTAGVWDYEIFIPVKSLVTGEVDAYQEVRVELKRTKGSTTSPAQKKWGEIYELSGIPCAICKGAKAAIEFVQGVIEEIGGEE